GGSLFAHVSAKTPHPRRRCHDLNPMLENTEGRLSYLAFGYVLGIWVSVFGVCAFEALGGGRMKM
ncbi:MAG: hypothetical protein Q4D55_11610, partial [Eubacteriales bacterium]|nr:hypothetical protein [Eubacteriales bacterium]